MTVVVVEMQSSVVRTDSLVRLATLSVPGMQGPPGADGAGSNPPTIETPSGVINGQNLVFTIVGTPRDPADLRLLLNGIELQQSVTGDYTFSGTTITFNAGLAPVSGDRLIASYIEE